MFAKLLKYEFRRSKGIMTLLCIITVGLFLVAALSLKGLLFSLASDVTDWTAVLAIAGIPSLTMCLFGVIACLVITQVLLIAQFYKSKFTDEGFLTFTLPTDAHRIYLASLVNILIWEAVILSAMSVGIFLFAILGTSADKLLNWEVLHSRWLEDSLLSVYLDIYDLHGFDWIVLALRLILDLIASCVLYTTCITIGATISRRRKVLVAVGIYFGVDSAVSFITNIATITALFLVDYMSLDTAMDWDIGSAVQALLHVIIIVGGYLLTTHLMKKKLNLA